MENNTKQHKSCLMVAPRTNYLQQFTGFHIFDITKDNFIFNRYFQLNLDINIGVIIQTVLTAGPLISFQIAWKSYDAVVFKSDHPSNEFKDLIKQKDTTICSCHVTYAFQNESTLYSCLNVKELSLLEAGAKSEL